MEGRGSGSSQSRPDTFIGSRDAPGSIKMFRTYAADAWIADRLAAPPAADQDAMANDVNSAAPSAMAACSSPASIPLWGRGSRHYEELSKLRRLRRKVIQGKAGTDTILWLRSGGLDRRLEEMTKEHGAGRYWDSDGHQIELRQSSFEDFLDKQSRIAG